MCHLDSSLSLVFTVDMTHLKKVASAVGGISVKDLQVLVELASSLLKN